MLTDSFKRPLKDLRISVTDRCNFRCTYCMPLDHYEWINKKEILTFEEISRLARLAVELGVEKIRLTGGEPLVRQDLPSLVENLASIQGLKDLCLTTNGALLAERVNALKSAGLRRVNISVDTLDAEKFTIMTKRGDLDKVLEGIFAAKEAGLAPIKLNAVVERGVNEDDIIPLVEFARQHGFGMRFIEYMDVGNSNGWRLDDVVTAAEIVAMIDREMPLEPLEPQYRGEVAERYRYLDGSGEIGVIASVSQPFCGDCTRARISADGHLYTCLFGVIGHDLRKLLRAGKTDEEIAAFIERVWSRRRDRYSELRSSETSGLVAKPEMSYIGG
jgi:GTP 3',8-cyclase